MYRETNRLAEELANYVFSLPLDFHSFYLRPDFATSIIFEDPTGAKCPRNVRV